MRDRTILLYILRGGFALCGLKASRTAAAAAATATATATTTTLHGKICVCPVLYWTSLHVPLSLPPACKYFVKHPPAWYLLLRLLFHPPPLDLIYLTSTQEKRVQKKSVKVAFTSEAKVISHALANPEAPQNRSVFSYS